MRRPARTYPGGREFAFSILDDTDDATVANVKPIYDLLFELGMRTTKTVWPLDCPEGSDDYFAGSTLADEDYRRFAQELRERGFELTWHAATMESSTRERTVRGLEVFKREFGHYPTLHCNHGENRENIYWGAKRYRNPLLRVARRLARRDPAPQFCGEVEESEYFWGDLCRQHFRFVRGFTWYDVNTRRRDPGLVYRLSWTPYVDCWFSTSDAADVGEFNTVFTRGSIDRLRAERGVCILSTHLGKGFVRNGRVDPAVEDTLRYVASLPGWFAPVSEILQHFRDAATRLDRPYWRHALYELRHVIDRARRPR
ncbi:MAG: hypothetical protein M3282_04945 [Gemmatimonadota bacterium]|nr:hypothetical protein [Gemmatimonadota bacterium]